MKAKRPVPGMPFADTWTVLLLLVVAVVIGGIYAEHIEQSKWKDVKSKGVFTVARVLRYETGEFESRLRLEIYWHGRTIPVTIDQDCGEEDQGHYYFVKVRKENPALDPIFYNEDEAPGCLLAHEKYFPGWDSIPDCE